MLKKILLISLLSIGMYANVSIGVVDFSKCITDSKYGKQEQEKIENIKTQWTTLISESEKEMEEISKKLKDEEYLESISPEAEEDLKLKLSTLQNDSMKYRNQLYQILNQANYLLIQNISEHVINGSEVVAKKKNLNFIINKEAFFSYDPKKDFTKSVIIEMDKDFEKENIAQNKEKDAKK